MSSILAKYSWVDDLETVNKLASEIDSQQLYAVDTEFERSRTFYLNPALLQIWVGDRAYLVDISIPGMGQVIMNKLDAVIIHSGSEDIELWQQLCQQTPNNIFDTQIAASLCGYETHASYQKLVEQLLGIELDKSESRSDWLQRPLSDEQIAYAIEDIKYLPEIKSILEEKLEERGMNDLFRHLMQAAKTNILNDAHNEKLYLKLVKSERLNVLQKKRLWLLLHWRDQLAKKRNKPRNWILNPLQITQVVKYANSYADLMKMKLHPKFIKYNGMDLIKKMNMTDTVDNADLPVMVKLNQGQASEYHAMCESLQSRCEQFELAPSVIANKAMVKRLAFEGKSLDDLTAWGLLSAVV